MCLNTPWRRGRTDRREDAETELRKLPGSSSSPSCGHHRHSSTECSLASPRLGLWGRESPFNRSALHSELPLLTPLLSGSLYCDSGPSMGREAHAAEEPRPSQRARCLASPAPGAPEHCLPDIFLLILLCDGDVPAVGFQFVLKNPPESIVLHAERVIEHGGDVVLSGGEHRGGGQGGPASSLARGG